MSNPDWFSDLAESLRMKFDGEESQKVVQGEQFFRDYILENPLANYTEEEEDQIVEDHFEPFQTYLGGLEWVDVDIESSRWSKNRGKLGAGAKKSTSAVFHCDKARLDGMLNQKDGIGISDIEWTKNELLIEGCDYDKIEQLRYRMALEIDKHENYTKDDKAEAWQQAAKVSDSNKKSAECFERASDLMAEQFKYDEAADYLESAIYRLDSSLGIDAAESAVSRRVRLIFIKENKTTHDQTERLIRKCRIFYDQAGNRNESSKLFVLEADINKRKKSIFVQFIVFLYWLFAKYGESPIRVFWSSILLIVIWALIYRYMGISYNLKGEGAEGELITSIYFSIVTFTTLGYGDFSPVAEARIFASIQAMLGLFMTSLFLVTFVRKYSR